ncbi:S1 family peptidase [Amycolatopsis pigmentata]|uniref:S1 family peptidase n=1 Tax=Amycolatopsis pigmentata TaxID=450801 RepID=A0ABW5G213_9PSEU
MLRKSVVGLAAVAAVLAGTVPAAAVSGGTPVPDPAAAPWMATIASVGDDPLTLRAFCGGVLIAPDRIATAGHCLDHGDPTRWEVYLGSSTLSAHPGKMVKIKGFAVHQGFRLIPSGVAPELPHSSAVADDVAIIQLAEPQWGTPFLPVAHRTPEVGAPVEIYGHGLTKQPAPPDPLSAFGDVLQRGDLKVIDDKSCNSQLAGIVDGPSVLCTQAPATTICAGDSGGPLVHDTLLGREVVGFASFAGEVLGKKCGEDGYADGFADAAVFHDWLTRPRPVLAPMPLGEPRITGSHTAGSTMTCQPPEWAPGAPVSSQYQWDHEITGKDGAKIYVAIDGATKADLALDSELASEKLLCALTASTPGGTVEMYTDPV